MPSFIRCFLLIVTAIQGITPDKRDLASPLAIELLFPTEHNPSGFLDHNDSQGDVCEAAQRAWLINSARKAGHRHSNGSSRPA